MNIDLDWVEILRVLIWLIPMMQNFLNRFAYFLTTCDIVAIGNKDIKMARKRIALSLDPEYHELLTKLAEHQNKPVTAVVTDFLDASKPMAIAMNQAFEDLKMGKDLAEVQQKLFSEGLRAASEQMSKV